MPWIHPRSCSQWGEFFDIPFNKLFDSTSQLKSEKQQEHYLKYYPIPGKFNRKTWLEKDQMNFVFDQMCNGNTGIKRNFFSLINFLWPKAEARLSTPPQGIEGSLANVLPLIRGNSRTVKLDDFEDFKIEDKREQEYGNQAQHSYYQIL